MSKKQVNASWNNQRAMREFRKDWLPKYKEMYKKDPGVLKTLRENVYGNWHFTLVQKDKIWEEIMGDR